MSVPLTGDGQAERSGIAQTIGGFLAAVAIFAGALAIVYRPVRIAPVALIVALIAVGIGGRHERLATFAVAAVTIGWVAGMIAAVLTESPLY